MDWLDLGTLILTLLVVLLALRHPLQRPAAKNQREKKAAPESGLDDQAKRSDHDNC